MRLSERDGMRTARHRGPQRVVFIDRPQQTRARLYFKSGVAIVFELRAHGQEQTLGDERDLVLQERAVEVLAQFVRIERQRKGIFECIFRVAITKSANQMMPLPEPEGVLEVDIDRVERLRVEQFVALRVIEINLQGRVLVFVPFMVPAPEHVPPAGVVTLVLWHGVRRCWLDDQRGVLIRIEVEQIALQRPVVCLAEPAIDPEPGLFGIPMVVRIGAIVECPKTIGILKLELNPALRLVPKGAAVAEFRLRLPFIASRDGGDPAQAVRGMSDRKRTIPAVRSRRSAALSRIKCDAGPDLAPGFVRWRQGQAPSY